MANSGRKGRGFRKEKEGPSPNRLSPILSDVSYDEEPLPSPSKSPTLAPPSNVSPKNEGSSPSPSPGQSVPQANETSTLPRRRLAAGTLASIRKHLDIRSTEADEGLDVASEGIRKPTLRTDDTAPVAPSLSKNAAERTVQPYSVRDVTKIVKPPRATFSTLKPGKEKSPDGRECTSHTEPEDNTSVSDNPHTDTDGPAQPSDQATTVAGNSRKNRNRSTKARRKARMKRGKAREEEEEAYDAEIAKHKADILSEGCKIPGCGTEDSYFLSCPIHGLPFTSMARARVMASQARGVPKPEPKDQDEASNRPFAPGLPPLPSHELTLSNWPTSQYMASHHALGARPLFVYGALQLPHVVAAVVHAAQVPGPDAHDFAVHMFPASIDGFAAVMVGDGLEDAIMPKARGGGFGSRVDARLNAGEEWRETSTVLVGHPTASWCHGMSDIGKEVVECSHKAAELRAKKAEKRGEPIPFRRLNGRLIFSLTAEQKRVLLAFESGTPTIVRADLEVSNDRDYDQDLQEDVAEDERLEGAPWGTHPEGLEAEVCVRRRHAPFTAEPVDGSEWNLKRWVLGRMAMHMKCQTEHPAKT